MKKEAGELVREARAALRIKKTLKGKAGDLESATTAVEKALAKKDLEAVRRGLPTLDAVVDELLQRPRKSTMRNYVESIGGAILIALALRAFVVEAFKIPTSSMYPTLEINDHIFVNKFIYGLRIPFTDTKLFEWRSPKRGEVIVFEQPCEKRDYIKRIVAVAGDTVEVRCDVVYVNGSANPNDILQESCPPDNEGTCCAQQGNCCAHDENEGDAWVQVQCTRWSESVADLTYSTYQDPSRSKDRAQWMSSPNDFPSFKDFPGDGGPSCATPKAQMGVEGPPKSGKPGVCDGSRRAVCTAPDQVQGKIEPSDPATTPAGLPEDCKLSRHYIVPEGHVFVMGDNRPNSNDSRVWGSVPLNHIKGKALFMWFSYKNFPGSIRWDRIGNFVH